MSRTIATAAADELRQSHYVLDTTDGLYKRSTLLELARTNIALKSEDFTTTWINFASSDSGNTDTAPDGNATADRLIEDATPTTDHHLRQSSLTITSNATCAFSVYLKAGTRSLAALSIRDQGTTANRVTVWFNLATGALGSSANAGTGSGATGYITALDNGWYRCTVVGAINNSATTAECIVHVCQTNGSLSSSGDGASYIVLWGAQFENAASFPTSYIPTTTASVTRAVDVMSLPIPSGMTTPGAMTVYVKFVERGTAFGANFARIVHVGESGADISKSCFQIFKSSGGNFYTAILTDSGAATTSTSSAGAVSFGDTVELLVTVSTTGVVQISQALNGGSFVAGMAGAAGGLPAQWGTGTAKIWLGQVNGGNAGATALLALKFARGAQSLANMRSFA